jgi:hypothetical protein
MFDATDIVKALADGASPESLIDEVKNVCDQYKADEAKKADRGKLAAAHKVSEGLNDYCAICDIDVSPMTDEDALQMLENIVAEYRKAMDLVNKLSNLTDTMSKRKGTKSRGHRAGLISVDEFDNFWENLNI